VYFKRESIILRSAGWLAAMFRQKASRPGPAGGNTVLPVQQFILTPSQPTIQQYWARRGVTKFQVYRVTIRTTFKSNTAKYPFKTSKYHKIILVLVILIN